MALQINKLNPANKILAILDLEKCKQLITKTPADEVTILCPHWSINGPRYSEQEADNNQFDMDEFEHALGAPVIVSDYDDLIADPHGVWNA